MNKLFLPILLLLAAALLFSCGEETVANPKPRAYPRIDFPSGADTTIKLTFCPFSFETGTYTEIQRDTLFFDQQPAHPCWFDLVTPQLNGRIHMSYYPISSLAEYEELREDAFQLAGKHTIKANYIEEIPVTVNPGSHGFAFAIEGEVASPFQFFLSDSTGHFVRGAVYVNAEARPDSLAPVYEFLEADVSRLLSSLRWVEEG